jgi:hypothetical protein
MGRAGEHTGAERPRVGSGKECDGSADQVLRGKSCPEMICLAIFLLLHWCIDVIMLLFAALRLKASRAGGSVKENKRRHCPCPPLLHIVCATCPPRLALLTRSSQQVSQPVVSVAGIFSRTRTLWWWQRHTGGPAVSRHESERCEPA